MSRSVTVRRRGQAWEAIWWVRDPSDGRHRQRTKSGFGHGSDALDHGHNQIAAITRGEYTDPTRMTFREFAEQKWSRPARGVRPSATKLGRGVAVDLGEPAAEHRWLASYRDRRPRPEPAVRRPLAGRRRSRVRGRRSSLLQRPELVEQIVQWQSQGWSYRSIAETLSATGEPTLSGKGKWAISSVHSALQRANHPRPNPRDGSLVEGRPRGCPALC
jgi:hypothetical protein